MGGRLGLPYSEVTPLDQIHQTFNEQGFAIIKEHQLSDGFCEEAKDEVWRALEALITRPADCKIRRDDPSTYENFFKLGPLDSMLLQHLGFSHLPTVWKAREAAAPIFARLWNVEPNQLISSMDAISFQIAPEKFSPPKGHFSPRQHMWWHTDQRIIGSSGQCIQGLYNLCECGPKDGCLSVLEGSHKFHKELRPKFYANTHDDDYSVASDWHPLSDEERKFYVTEKGCRWRFVCPPKGAFVIWDSRTIHCGTEARIPRPEARDRLVYYVCMLPKIATIHQGYSCTGVSEQDLQRRISAFQQQRTTNHWPYPIKLFPKYPRTLSKDITVEEGRIPRMMMEDLSPLQRSLLGL